MLPSLQPSRPKYPPPSQPSPLPLQQTRPSSHQTSHPPSDPPSQTPRTPLTPPRTQLEAMPPAPAPSHSPFAPSPGPVLQPRLSGTPLSQHYDSAVRHPVFFTAGNLRKPPFPLPGAASGGLSPVAFGYVVEHRAAAVGEARTKL